jgi:hypothetical protein
VQKLTLKAQKFADAAKSFKSKAEQYAAKYNKLVQQLQGSGGHSSGSKEASIKSANSLEEHHN